MVVVCPTGSRWFARLVPLKRDVLKRFGDIFQQGIVTCSFFVTILMLTMDIVIICVDGSPRHGHSRIPFQTRGTGPEMSLTFCLHGNSALPLAAPRAHSIGLAG